MPGIPMFKSYTELMNVIIERRDYKRFLEIGVQNGHNLRGIQCEQKFGVDLCCAAPATHHMSSDAFFREAHANNLKFDLIFVDGDHRFLPALRDMVNAIDCLSEDGTVFCDNLNPRCYNDQTLGQDGTAWRAWATLRVSRRDLTMVAIDFARGWGIIRRGQQELYMHDEPQAGLPCYFGEQWDLTWEYLERFRHGLLNLVTPQHFLESMFEPMFPIKPLPLPPPPPPPVE